MLGFSCAIMITWEGLLSCVWWLLNVGNSLTQVSRVFVTGLSKSVPYALEVRPLSNERHSVEVQLD